MVSLLPVAELIKAELFPVNPSKAHVNFQKVVRCEIRRVREQALHSPAGLFR